MAAGRLLVPAWARALDSDGDPISAAISLFNTGTDALATIFSDEALTVPLANPVQSNSAGRFPAIWASDAVTYDWSVEAPYGPPGSPFTGTGLTTALAADILAADAAEAAADAAEASAAAASSSETTSATILAEIEDIVANAPDAPSVAGKLDRDGDNVQSGFLANVGAVGSVALAASGGPALVGYQQPATDSVLRTAQAKLNELPLSPEDFGAVGDGVTDDGPAFQKLFKAFPTRTGFDVYCKAATYRIATGSFYFTRSIRMFGRDRYGTTFDFSDNVQVVNAPYNCHVIFPHSNNITGSSSHANPITLPVGTVGNYGEGAGLFDVTVECNPAIVDGIGVFYNVAAPSTNLIVRAANLHCIVFAGAATQLVTRGGTTGPSGLDIGGNANLGTYISIRGIGAVNGDGIHCSGSDANQINFISPEGIGCKGWALNDDTLHGNQWIGGHTSSCLYGSARGRPASPNRAYFPGLYSEGDSGDENPSGSMFEFGERTLAIGQSGETDTGDKPFLNPELVGLHSGRPVFVADLPNSRDLANGATSASYGYVGRGVWEIRTTDGPPVGSRRSGPTYTAFYSGSREYMLIPTTDIGSNLKAGLPFFPDGISLNVSHRQIATDSPGVGFVTGAVAWRESITLGGPERQSNVGGTWYPTGIVGGGSGCSGSGRFKPAHASRGQCPSDQSPQRKTNRNLTPERKYDMADKKLREWAVKAHEWIVWADQELKGGSQTQDDGPGGLPPPPPPPPPPGGGGIDPDGG